MTAKEILTTKILINKFIHQNNYLILNNINNQNYLIEIKDGSVNAKIKNCQGETVGINYLEEGDKIKVKCIKSDPNNFIIKKIYVNTKYTFNSDSSEDFELY